MFTYVDGLLKYKDASGQWHEADVIKGESAYQAAVRLGIFSGTESEYYNKITKLQHLPDLADSDGYYMISQQNNEMSLIRFRIPQAPATDGTYTLKATVSGGTPTYTWEEVSGE